jgi:hypothetical protein
MRIVLGNSTTGYDSAEITLTKTGKFKLVSGTIHGRSSVIKKLIANANRGQLEYITKAGDSLPVYIKD